MAFWRLFSRGSPSTPEAICGYSPFPIIAGSTARGCYISVATTNAESGSSDWIPAPSNPSPSDPYDVTCVRDRYRYIDRECLYVCVWLNSIRTVYLPLPMNNVNIIKHSLSWSMIQRSYIRWPESQQISSKTYICSQRPPNFGLTIDHIIWDV